MTGSDVDVEDTEVNQIGKALLSWSFSQVERREK